MSEIVNVEEVEFDSGLGEVVIGFNLHYDDGVVYPIGPVLLRAELDAVVKFYAEKMGWGPPAYAG